MAENSIRPFTIGRKNWLFSGSLKGARTSAAIYSIIETAKANGLTPYKYLKYIFEELPRRLRDSIVVFPNKDKIKVASGSEHQVEVFISPFNTNLIIKLCYDHSRCDIILKRSNYSKGWLFL